jgi:hypothetical protein
LFGSAFATVFGVCCICVQTMYCARSAGVIRHGMCVLCTCHGQCTSPKQTTSVQQKLQLATVLGGVLYMACASRCMMCTYRDPAHRRTDDNCMLCTSCYLQQGTWVLHTAHVCV